jgi:DNA invertase Pin-like site-specific DNA recombinase
MALKEAVAYARYSTDKQNARSIDDQFGVCDKVARQHGYKIVKYYKDAAISGAGTLGRAGWLELMRAVTARERTFGAVIIENCSRMSRDLADSARDFKRIDRRQVELIDIEGKLNTMRIGMSGIMNEEFRKHLGNMMRRTWDGRVKDNLIPGKPPYGHRLSDQRFHHEIDPAGPASVVLRLFNEYVNRVPEREIAAGFNREGIPSPSGGRWNHQVFTTGSGSGRGMISNRRYIGELVWNERRNVTSDNETKCKRKGNPEDLIVKEFPHLRIIPQDLWDAAQALRAERSRKSPKPRVYAKTVTHHMIADKIVCGECGGLMRIVGSKAGEAKRVGCSNARHKGICPNSKSYNLDEIEATFLHGSKEIDAEAVAALTKGAHKGWAEQQKAASVQCDDLERKINVCTEKINRIGDIILEIDPSDVPAMMEKLKAETLKRAGLRTQRELLGPQSNVVTLLPESIRLACTKIRDLADVLVKGKLTDEEAAPRRMALGNFFEAVQVHQTGKRKPVEITPHMRLAAMTGVSTMPRMQSSKEVLEEQGHTSVDLATQRTLSSQKHGIVNLGRWQAAA